MARVDRLSPELQKEVQRLWDLCTKEDTHLTFDAWVALTQIEPEKKTIASAAAAVANPEPAEAFWLGALKNIGTRQARGDSEPIIIR